MYLRRLPWIFNESFALDVMRSNSNRYAIQPDCPSRDVFVAPCGVNRKHKCFYLTCLRSTYGGNKYLRSYLQLIPRNCKAATPPLHEGRGAAAFGERAALPWKSLSEEHLSLECKWDSGNSQSPDKRTITPCRDAVRRLRSRKLQTVTATRDVLIPRDTR